MSKEKRRQYGDKYAHKPPMTKEEVIAELRRLQSEGHSMKTPDFDGWFYRRIGEHFGNYKNAKKELGIKPERNIGSGPRERELSDVLDELKRELPNITDKTVFHKEYRHIGYYSRKKYGDVYEVFRLIGAEIPPTKERASRNKYWTEERIADELRSVFNDSGVKSAHWLINNGHSKLVNGVSLVYGTWNAGLIANGYEVAYETPKTKWTQDYAKEQVINALINGTEPTFVALSEQIRGFGSYIRKHSGGGISDFFEEIGVCPLTVRPKKKVSRQYRQNYTSIEGLQREILRLWCVGCPLNYNFIRKHRYRLIQRANEHIGSWRKAVESVGIDYAEITKSSVSNVLSDCGTDFEVLFAEMLSELGYEFIREGNEMRDVMDDFTIKPDFILPNWRFIDCKLSEWTDASEMLKKYQQYQPNGITIVYLRGKNRRVERGRKWKYEHVSVYQFTKDLPDERRTYYETKFNEIARKADEGAIAR